MDKDIYLNSANGVFSDSHIGVKYQDEHPDIPESFNVFQAEVNTLLVKKHSINFQVFNDFITQYSNVSGLKSSYARKINYKQFDLGLALGIKYIAKENSIAPDLLPLNESPHYKIVKNIDFPFGLNLKWNSGEDTLGVFYHTFVKLGYFGYNPLEPDQAHITPGALPSPFTQGGSITISSKWFRRNIKFRTDLYATKIRNKEKNLLQVGIEQAFIINDNGSEIGFNLDYYSNNTLGLGINYTLRKIKASISKGFPTFSNEVKMANPFYLMALNYSFLKNR